MRVLIVAQHINFFRNLDTVLRELCARGHEVVFLHGTRLDDPRLDRQFEQKGKRGIFQGRGLRVVESEISGVTSGYRPEPPERWQRLLSLGRQVINRAIYFRRNHPSPERVVGGLEKSMPPALVRQINAPFWRRLLSTRAALRIWRWIEIAGPASETLVNVVRETRPDVVVVAPTVWPKTPVESDYLRAAHSLGLPTIGYLNSWDNLTSKGTVHVLPDIYVVWNEALAEEAIALHDVPAETIRLAGAPHVDRVFTMQPARSVEAMSAEMGCPIGQPYVVFLCSSRTLVESEVELVRRLRQAMDRRFGGSGPTLVVRPHPTNATTWEEFQQSGVALHPKLGDQADSPESWQDYYDQLAHSACVIGLNTTAFLEAVVIDRPCLTIVADEFWPIQGRTGHFRHLVKGDFMEVAADVDGVAERIARILEGEDVKAAGRREFTRWFLRPHGLEMPACTVVADVIERAARPAPAGARPTAADPVPGMTVASDGVGR